MPRSTLFQMTWLCSVILWAIGLPLQAGDHAVRISRPVKVGERFHVKITEKEKSTTETSIQGEDVEKKQKTIESSMEAISTVLEVNERRRANRFRLEIFRLIQKFDDDPDEHVVLAKGAVVEAYLDKGKEVFLVNGKPVAESTSDVLGDLVGLSKSPISDEDVFVTKPKRKVGERWSINRALAAQSMSNHQTLTATKDQIKGHVKLDSVEVVNGEEYLTLSADLEVSRFMPEQEGDLKYRKAAMKGQMTRRYATDMSVGTVFETMKLTLDLEMVSEAKADALAFTLKNQSTTTRSRSAKLIRNQKETP